MIAQGEMRKSNLFQSEIDRFCSIFYRIDTKYWTQGYRFYFFSFFWQNLYKLSNRNEKRTAKKRDDIRRDECFVFQRIEKWKSRVIFSIWNQDYFKYIKYEPWYSKNFAIFAIYFKIVIKYEFGIFYPLQNIRFPS